MKLRPLDNRIIIKKVDIEVRSAGGLILSGQEVDTSKDIGVGKVLFVGKGKRTDKGEFIPTEVQIGDYVNFNDRMPLRWHYNGEYVWYVRESDILSVIEDENIHEVTHSDGHGKEFEMKSQMMS